MIQSIKNPNRVYIGHSMNIKGRWTIHVGQLNKQKHHSPQLQFHFNKYGLGDLRLSVICECERQDLINYEQFFIDIYKPYFNCSPNASSTAGYKFTEKQKAKLRGRTPWNKGIPLSDETKKKVSASLRKVVYTEERREAFRKLKTGCKLSEETKRKISESHKGIRPTSETLEKLRVSHLGQSRPHTDEQKRKIAESNRGQKRTSETKLKMSLAKKGRIPWNKGKKFIDGKYVAA